MVRVRLIELIPTEDGKAHRLKPETRVISADFGAIREDFRFPPRPHLALLSTELSPEAAEGFEKSVHKASSHSFIPAFLSGQAGWYGEGGSRWAVECINFGRPG